MRPSSTPSHITNNNHAIATALVPIEQTEVMNREDVILEIEQRYRQSGRSLNEFQRRLWAATEAMKLGWGGISIVSKALRISPNTIKRGIQEIATGQADSLSDANARIRKPGGGRKSQSTSSGQSTHTASTKGATDPESERGSSDGLDENRLDQSLIPTSDDQAPVMDKVPNKPASI